jgi:hypothetical protein
MKKIYSLYIDFVFYFILIFISTSLIGYNKILLSFLIVITYIFASRVFFLLVFVPKVFYLINYLMSNVDVLFKLKYKKNKKHIVDFVFKTNFKYQRNKSGFNKKMVRFSYWSFIFIPLLLYLFYELNALKKYINNNLNSNSDDYFNPLAH